MTVSTEHQRTEGTQGALAGSGWLQRELEWEEVLTRLRRAAGIVPPYPTVRESPSSSSATTDEAAAA